MPACSERAGVVTFDDIRRLVGSRLPACAAIRLSISLNIRYGGYATLFAAAGRFWLNFCCDLGIIQRCKRVVQQKS